MLEEEMLSTFFRNVGGKMLLGMLSTFLTNVGLIFFRNVSRKNIVSYILLNVGPNISI
jgi:hypothetical protein